MYEDILKEYIKNKISLDILKTVNSELKINEKKLNRFALQRRLDTVQESISWEKGPNTEDEIIKVLYRFGDNYIAVGKPGKEASSNYKGCKNYITGEKTNNPNDMHPIIFLDGKKIEDNLDFIGMFERLEGYFRDDFFALELLGMLFYRNAFLLDHFKDKFGNWRYKPPKSIIELINDRISKIKDMPTEIFIFFLEVIALNEDVKMFTLGHSNLIEDYGRVNTLLTFAHLILVFLGKRLLSKFAGSFARQPAGVAPMPKTKVFEYFPLMKPDLFENRGSF